jgi:hypothetical protein
MRSSAVPTHSEGSACPTCYAGAMAHFHSLGFPSPAILAVAASACTVSGVAAVYVCKPNSSVECTPGTTGYECNDTVTTPNDEYTLARCSDPSNFGGSTTYYCCPTPSSVTSTCAQDLSITCSGSATGYTCSGTDAPDSTDSTMVCGGGLPLGGKTSFCCEPKSTVTTTSTCSQDPSTTSCPSGVGYSCTGLDSPSSTDSTLTCGGGLPSNGLTYYCCASSTTSGGSPDASDEDAGVNMDASTTSDTPEETGLCSVGADTGNPTCDTCVESNCCNYLTACDTPDDAGVTNGDTACERVLGCLTSCISGNASVPADTLANCEDTCGVDYTAAELTNAAAIVTCETQTCASACQ